MKQSLNKNIFNIVKVGFFLSFLAVEILGFNIQSALADNSQCNNLGVGYVYNGSSCVAATSFTCSASNQSCPTGLTCVVGDGQCEQPCSSNASCVYNNESCNTQGYCTQGGQPSNNSGGGTGIQSGGTGIQAPGSSGGTGIQAPGGAAPTSNNSSATLYNPLPENDLTHVFLLITKSFLDIMGIWAVMFIIFGGFQMVLSSGNEEAYAKAKKTITWAVLGLAVAILSFSIVAIVEDLLQANIQAPTPTSQTTTNINI